jgi:hypothetical protein
VTPPAPLLEVLGRIKAAAAAAPGQWQESYWICIVQRPHAPMWRRTMPPT